MVFVMMNDPATGRVAVFDELDTISDPENPNSTRNAPLNNPVAHLPRVRFHSDFDYYQVHSIVDVTINHAAVAGVSVPIATTPAFTRYGQVVKTDHALVNHGLGYIPSYMIASGGVLIGQSSMIQADANGARTVSPYATSSAIRLLDVGISSANTLAAMSKTYQVIIFRSPAATSAFMADLDPANDVLELGYGKWNGTLRQLRQTVVADASPFDVPLGRTTDIRGGGSRTVLADGSISSGLFYAGSFAGSASVQCTVE